MHRYFLFCLLLSASVNVVTQLVKRGVVTQIGPHAILIQIYLLLLSLLLFCQYFLLPPTLQTPSSTSSCMSSPYTGSLFVDLAHIRGQHSRHEWNWKQEKDNDNATSASCYLCLHGAAPSQLWQLITLNQPAHSLWVFFTVNLLGTG